MNAALCGLAYGVALGSIPFAWLLHRIATGRDLRREGSGNPGAANVQRADGWGWGAVALALDAGKGAAAVALAAHGAGLSAGVFAAIGAVLGHMFTPWLSGRGGKGVATAAGAFAVLAPVPIAVAAAAFVLIAAATRFVALASVVAAGTLALALWFMAPEGGKAPAAGGLALLIAWRHRENFARMRAGTEPRLGDDTPTRWGA